MEDLHSTEPRAAAKVMEGRSLPNRRMTESQGEGERDVVPRWRKVGQRPGTDRAYRVIYIYI